VRREAQARRGSGGCEGDGADSPTRAANAQAFASEAARPNLHGSTKKNKNQQAITYNKQAKRYIFASAPKSKRENKRIRKDYG
jgi:hypothetical protein